jgi:hypothetical protein
MKTLLLLILSMNTSWATDLQCITTSTGAVFLTYQYQDDDLRQELSLYLGSERWDSPTKYRELCKAYTLELTITNQLVPVSSRCDMKTGHLLQVLGLVLLTPKENKVVILEPVGELSTKFYIDQGRNTPECENDPL